MIVRAPSQIINSRYCPSPLRRSATQLSRQDPMPMQVCVCGCDKGACIPQRGYERPRTDTVSQHGLTLFSAPYEEWTGQVGCRLSHLTVRKLISSIDSNADLAQGSGSERPGPQGSASHHRCEARYRGSEEDEGLPRGDDLAFGLSGGALNFNLNQEMR